MVLYAQNIVKYFFVNKCSASGGTPYIPLIKKAFPERSGGNTIFPLIKKKKKFENFLKQTGDSPKKKRNISANVSVYQKLRSNLGGSERSDAGT